MGFTKRNGALRSVLDVVRKNTGMIEQELLNDEKIYSITHMYDAVDFLYEALVGDKWINLFGDYDADGITSLLILTNLLTRVYCFTRGAKYLYRLPKRFSEGYGAKPEAIEKMEDNSYLILVDNGIKCFDAVKKAKEKGMKVLILDHHEPETDADGNLVLPEADVIVDPKAFPGEFNGYCGAGLALRFAEAVLADKRCRYHEGGLYPVHQKNASGYVWDGLTRALGMEKLIERLYSYAAIGTVCDAVSLTGENRRIVKKGLEVLNADRWRAFGEASTSYGLRCLVEKLGLEEIGEKSIGFKIGPCLNASGRLNDDGAEDAYLALMYDHRIDTAQVFAESLMAVNDKRKELSEEWMKRTVEFMQNNGMENDYPAVVHMPGMPEGIAGLISGRVAEKYDTPAFIFTDAQTDGLIKGSGRSDGDVDLNALLTRHTDLITAYGGHKGAAGISIRMKDLEAFRKALQDDLGAKPEKVEGETLYDLELNAADAEKMLEEVRKYGPYGEGNPEPEFLIENLLAIRDGESHYRELASNGIKIGTSYLSCITFDASDKYRALGTPERFNAVGKLSRNVFRGRKTTQFEITDLEKYAVVKPGMSALSAALAKKAAELSA